MKKRKPNNQRARVERFSRAILRQFRVAVVHIEPSGRQGMVDYGTGKNIPPGQRIAEAVCDIAHQWVIYFGVFCRDQLGRQYIKASEVAPQGIYKSDSLADVIKEHHRELVDGCNPAHVIGSGWIANPSGVSLDEEQAARIFKACGAWQQHDAGESSRRHQLTMKPLEVTA